MNEKEKSAVLAWSFKLLNICLSPSVRKSTSGCFSRRATRNNDSIEDH